MPGGYAWELILAGAAAAPARCPSTPTVIPMASTPTHPVSSLVILLNRLSLGLYLAMAGWGKLLGEFKNGFGSFARSDAFRGLQPSWLPDALAQPYGYALPALELVLGVLLVIGLWGRLAALGTALVLFSIALALLDAGRYFDGPGPFHHTAVMITLAIMLALIGPGGFSIDALRGKGKARVKTPA